MRSFAAILAVLTASAAQAGILAPGLNVDELAPPQAAGSTSENHVAVSPGGDLWWSAGTVGYQLVGPGTWGPAVSYHQNAGGPIANNSVSSAIAFDSSGRMYVN